MLIVTPARVKYFSFPLNDSGSFLFESGCVVMVGQHVGEVSLEEAESRRVCGRGDCKIAPQVAWLDAYPCSEDAPAALSQHRDYST